MTGEAAGQHAATERSDAASVPPVPPAVQALPTWLVAGPHSGCNAEWIVSRELPGPGRWLWLTGALQRPLAAQALARAVADRAGRLLLGTLPGGCACCAAGVQLGAGLARALRQHRRDGERIEGLILQLEPDGEAARLADNLREAGPEALWRIDAIVAVLPPGGLDGVLRQPGPGPASSRHGAARRLRCLGSAERVFAASPVRGGDGPAGAEGPAVFPLVPTPVGQGWAGVLIPASDGAADPRWSTFSHDPFGAASAASSSLTTLPRSAPWQVIARWPGAVRFDRRAVAGWLEGLAHRLEGLAQRGPGPAQGDSAPASGADTEFALIARTERDWLGWRAGAAALPLAWRLDSRLAVRGVLPPREVIDEAIAAAPLLR